MYFHFFNECALYLYLELFGKMDMSCRLFAVQAFQVERCCPEAAKQEQTENPSGEKKAHTLKVSVRAAVRKPRFPLHQLWGCQKRVYINRESKSPSKLDRD